MTKIYLDETTLKKHVYVNLENAISTLKEAKSITKSLNIPYDFKYRTYLKDLDENIEFELDSLNEVYNIMKNHSSMYSKVNNDINSELVSIENYDISLRQSAIK